MSVVIPLLPCPHGVDRDNFTLLEEKHGTKEHSITDTKHYVQSQEEGHTGS
jgi:hypothetical protein